MEKLMVQQIFFLEQMVQQKLICEFRLASFVKSLAVEILLYLTKKEKKIRRQ